MKLREIMEQAVSKHYSTLDEVSKFFREHKLNYALNGGKYGVSVGTVVYLAGMGIRPIPIQVYKATGWNISHNNIETLDDCKLPTICPYINIAGNKITSLVGISEIVKDMTYAGSMMYKGVFDCSWCDIAEGGLGLLLIPGMREIKWNSVSSDPQHKAFEIISKYLHQPADVFDCQQELIEAGLENFAKI